jgi:activator of 2-hydroxyglutaryl-CoA dehydratase
MSGQPIFVGVDVGSSRTKVAVLDPGKNLIGYAVKKSGTDFAATARDCLKISLKMAKVGQADIANAVSTGYGRKNVAYADDTRTEIGCHASGCYLSSISADRITKSSNSTRRAGAQALK